jgi:hypothetical protein
MQICKSLTYHAEVLEAASCCVLLRDFLTCMKNELFYSVAYSLMLNMLNQICV